MTDYKKYTICPECGAPISFNSGCYSCPACGYGKCGKGVIRAALMFAIILLVGG